MLTTTVPNRSSFGAQPSNEPLCKLLPHATHGPVLLAFDGQSRDYLFNAAEYASARLAAEVRVVCATESIPIEVSGFVEIPVSIDATDERAESQRADAKVAIREWSVDNAWQLNVEIGPVDAVITELATKLDASLVVLGQGRHNLVDRAFGVERTVSVASATRVPLLSVHRSGDLANMSVFAGIRSVVVGMDYSSASIRAARMAAELVIPGGKMTFVHVRTLADLQWNGWLAWETAYDAGLAADEKRMRELLSPFTGIQLEFVAVHGYPAAMLLEYAQRVNADLIAVGTEQRSFINRMMIGSVARKILRDARCHVLAAPSPQVAVLAELARDRARVQESSESKDWTAMLNLFTRQNAGRQVRVDAQRTFGSPQTQQRHTVFSGAVYEPATQQMQFMLGDDGVWHLTHMCTGATRVARVFDSDAGDLALVVTHADGELTLVFE